ncbi:MAG: multiprotein bridging factor aMBF1 [Candidatus Marsarchaeota archaeon]|jgi:putative transcription factor|nr:multiprotein bridging factor aMBF1 [Candidatus Marsarchaeota archaeon]
MYDCEICGRKTDTLYIIDVEGAEMTACAKCSAGKNIVDTITQDAGQARKQGPLQAEDAPIAEELAEDFGDMIRMAREKMGLPLSVLAERINEKESTLNRVEHGRMLPPAQLIKKLEKQLGIKLTAVPEQLPKTNARPGSEPVTLGDAAGLK